MSFNSLYFLSLIKNITLSKINSLTSELFFLRLQQLSFQLHVWQRFLQQLSTFIKAAVQFTPHTVLHHYFVLKLVICHFFKSTIGIDLFKQQLVFTVMVFKTLATLWGKEGIDTVALESLTTALYDQVSLTIFWKN